MKTFFITVFLIGFCMISAQEVSLGEQRFSTEMNLGHDISSLAKLAGQSDVNLNALRGQTFFLHGSLGVVVAETEEPYQLLVELLAGEWQGTKALTLHRIFLLVDDPVFAELFQDSEGRQVSAFAHEPQLVTDAAGRQVIMLRLRSLLLDR